MLKYVVLQKRYDMIYYYINYEGDQSCETDVACIAEVSSARKVVWKNILFYVCFHWDLHKICLRRIYL